jgi:Sulfotransferase family
LTHGKGTRHHSSKHEFKNMLSRTHRFIFLHVPRTGGNAIQQQLLPFSEDRKDVRGGRDGVDTFEVRGPMTSHKHAMLEDYARRIDISGFQVAMSVRDPIERALSLYFAPIRVRTERRRAHAPFDIDAFERLVSTMDPMADFIRIDGRVSRMPDILLRFEDGVPNNLKVLGERLSLPLSQSCGHLNAGENEQRNQLRSDRRVRDLARARFAEDFEIFGY